MLQKDGLVALAKLQCAGMRGDINRGLVLAYLVFSLLPLGVVLGSDLVKSLDIGDDLAALVGKEGTD